MKTEKINIEYCENDYKRIDKYLSEYFENKLSRNIIQNLIKKKFVLVNNLSVKTKYKLKKNDKIFIELEEKDNEIKPEKKNLDIVYEDDDLIIINKKEGIITHPAGKIISGTLVNYVLGYFNGLNINRYGLVHRLDKDTSGAIIFAKNNITQSKLSDMFKNRKIQKVYYALTSGKFEESQGIINYPIKRSQTNRQLMTINTSGRKSLTYFYVEKQNEKFAFLKLIPKTGRTHQLRIHCKSIGHPILGDVLYNKKSKIDRLMLHAYSIEFMHPISNKKIYVEAPFPESYNKILYIYFENDRK